MWYVCRVSIRSRLFGREKRCCGARSGRARKFQSAPGFLAGRNPEIGETYLLSIEVSIRSRLFGREKPIAVGGSYVFRAVSIRSRLFGREKQSKLTLVLPYLIVSIRSRLFGREKLTARPT